MIRMIDGVDSERNSVGQRFAASVDEPVVIDGQTVIPRGADVIVKLVEAKESGKFEGRTSLTLDLMSVMVNGRMVDVTTETVHRRELLARQAHGEGGRRNLRGARHDYRRYRGQERKGAAIGLGAGAATGAGAEILTKGQRVKIPIGIAADLHAR